MKWSDNRLIQLFNRNDGFFKNSFYKYFWSGLSQEVLIIHNAKFLDASLMYVARYHNRTIEFTQEQILSSISSKLYRIPNTSLKIRAGASSLNHRTQLNVLIMHIHTHFIFQVSISICKRKATIYKLIQNIFPMYILSWKYCI